MLESIYRDGKIFKEIDFQILLKNTEIRELKKSIVKSYKLAGAYGPSGTDNMGIDYSRVTSSTPVAHIGLEDAIRLSDRDYKRIKLLSNEVTELRRKKRKLLKILEALEGTEEKIYYHRVILKKTQEKAAEDIGLSTRQLQRIETKMKSGCISLVI
ncbi:MAG: hypothetical protein K0R46_3481 [Herbinix sp.]|jgi:hypothetical protein|nr:hypothetical protein [Herbinix sp.]